MQMTKNPVVFTPADEEEKTAYELWRRISLDAVTEGASDIHMEPYRVESLIRYRVDGMLQTISRQSNETLKSLVRVLKKLSKMNPDITDLPQSGIINLSSAQKADGKEIAYEIRVRTFPTFFGEKIVCRILNMENFDGLFKGGLDGLGLEGEDLKTLKSLINKPYGLIVFSGPTGSGKTTTLYTVLSTLAKETEERCSIVSLENPVEVILDGVIQARSRCKDCLNELQTFKAVMRQDPDIISISLTEDFDPETASLCLHSAMTGHLILMQAEASDTASTIHTLFASGMKPYMVSLSLEGIVSQRLMRKICPHCKKEVKIDTKTINKIKAFVDTPSEPVTLWKGEGCQHCRFTGYRGRMAVYEILTLNDSLTEMISNKASVTELREAINNLGIKTLRKAAVMKALKGETSLEEAIRCSSI